MDVFIEEGVFFVDVRNLLEVRSLGKIKGVLNILIDELCLRLDEIFKDKKIVLYC